MVRVDALALSLAHFVPRLCRSRLFLASAFFPSPRAPGVPLLCSPRPQPLFEALRLRSRSAFWPHLSLTAELALCRGGERALAPVFPHLASAQPEGVAERFQSRFNSRCFEKRFIGKEEAVG